MALDFPDNPVAGVTTHNNGSKTWVWNGEVWKVVVEYGPKGDTGASGEDGATGDPGPQGVPGEQGVQGSAGAAGTGVTFMGQVATVNDLPGSGTQGDAYLVQDDDSLHIHDGTVFVDGGSIQGPQGVQGNTGIQGIQGPPAATYTVDGTTLTITT